MRNSVAGGAARLKRYTIRVLGARGQSVGTGFVVSDTRFVTCAHVVRQSGGGPGKAVHFIFAQTGERRRGHVEREYWEETADVAFVAFEGRLPAGVAAAPLARSQRAEARPFYLFGYPQVGDLEGTWAVGEIVGTVSEDSRPLLQLRSDTLAQGASGGAVALRDTEDVVGMMWSIFRPSSSNGPQATAFATPTETLQAIYPELTLHELSPPPSFIRWYLVALSVLAFGMLSYIFLRQFNPPPPTPIALVETVSVSTTVMPMATTTLTSTPAPTATLPPVRAFVALGARPMQEIVASKGRAWFATDRGLVEHDRQTGSTRQLGADVPVKQVALDADQGRLWMVLGDGQVGYINLIDDQITLPVSTLPAEFELLLAVETRREGGVWVGGTGEMDVGLVSFAPPDQWSTLPRPGDNIIPAGRVEGVVEDPDDALWIRDGLSVYRFYEGQWMVFNEETSDNALPNHVDDLLVDGEGRIWFAHENGLTVLAAGMHSPDRGDVVWRTCASASIPGVGGPVHGLDVSLDGQLIWLATTNGLTWVEATVTLPRDCQRWEWGASWRRDEALASFWEGQMDVVVDEYETEGGNYRLRIWLYNQRDEDVLFVDVE